MTGLSNDSRLGVRRVKRELPSKTGMRPPPDPSITDYLEIPSFATPPSWVTPPIGVPLQSRWCDPSRVIFLPDKRTKRWALEMTFLDLVGDRAVQPLAVGETVAWWFEVDDEDDDDWANIWFPQRVLDVRGDDQRQAVVTLCDRLYTQTDPDCLDVVRSELVREPVVTGARLRALLEVFHLNTLCPVCGDVGSRCVTFNAPDARPRVRKIDGNEVDLDSPTYRCRCNATWLVGEAGTVVVTDTGPDYTRVPSWAKNGRPRTAR